MYAWYNDSLMCFAYLDDVTSVGGVTQRNEIRDSEWFARFAISALSSLDQSLITAEDGHCKS